MRTEAKSVHAALQAITERATGQVSDVLERRPIVPVLTRSKRNQGLLILERLPASLVI